MSARIDRKNPSFDLQALQIRCAGLGGSADDEWSIGWQKGEPYIRMYSAIGSVIANAIKRNREAIAAYQVDEYPDGSFSVQLLLEPSKCRNPWLLLRTDGSGQPLSAEATARLRRSA